MKGEHIPAPRFHQSAGHPARAGRSGGQPGFATIFGGGDANTGARSGGRLTAGAWLDERRTFGIEGNFFMLAAKASTFNSPFSGGNPILARPVIDAASGTPIAEQVAFPGNLAGSVATSANDSGLVGAGFLFRERAFAVTPATTAISFGSTCWPATATCVTPTAWR